MRISKKWVRTGVKVCVKICLLRTNTKKKKTVTGDFRIFLGLKSIRIRFSVKIRTGQGLKLVVEQNGEQINLVKFFEDSKKMG